MITTQERIDLMRSKTFYDGKFFGSYKERMKAEVKRMLALVLPNGEAPDVETRKELINALFDAYVDQTGETPDGVQANLLGNWILLESLTDNHPDKVTREEYPVMSKRQLRTRYNRERADELIQDTHTEQKYLGGKKQSTFKKSE